MDKNKNKPQTQTNAPKGENATYPFASAGAQSADNNSPAPKKTFLQVVKTLAKRWFIDAFSGMALGLFATLIAGTIICQIALLIGTDNSIGALLEGVGKVAKTAMGAGIGVGVAHSLKKDKLVMFCSLAAGLVGAFATGGFLKFSSMPLALGAAGNPIGAYLAALITAEVCSLYAGKTRLDIILVPIGALLVASFVAVTLCPPVTWLIEQISKGIAVATEWSPLVMGVVVSVVMGLILTLPTSSAAIWISLIPTAATVASHYYLFLAGGAAAVGCACHMVGFAFLSFKENRWSGLLAQGLGTSMLQIPNLMKNPKILIPPVVASAVCGGLSTTVFKLLCDKSAGMGTSGLVGVIGTVTASIEGGVPALSLVLGIALLMFILPAVISWSVGLLLRNISWIKENDLKLDL